MSEPARRVYTSVSIAGEEGAWQVLLDGRVLRTPRKRQVNLPTQELAEAIAREWEAQGARIDPFAMPLTRLANTAIDRVEPDRERVIGEIVAMAAHDLVCYRAEAPQALCQRQAAAWDPVLDWAMAELDARFAVTTGVVSVEQPPQALAAFARHVRRQSSWRLVALHNMATLTGSALIALMCAQRPESAEEAWRRAHVDEDWQIEHWGEDAEAMQRRRARKDEFMACLRLIGLAG